MQIDYGDFKNKIDFSRFSPKIQFYFKNKN